MNIKQKIVAYIIGFQFLILIILMIFANLQKTNTENNSNNNGSSKSYSSKIQSEFITSSKNQSFSAVNSSAEDFGDSPSTVLNDYQNDLLDQKIYDEYIATFLPLDNPIFAVKSKINLNDAVEYPTSFVVRSLTADKEAAKRAFKAWVLNIGVPESELQKMTVTYE